MLALQRARLLEAAVGAFAELGYGSASVAAICERAGVSRRTYYEVFENREQCLAAILAGAQAKVEGEIASAQLEDASWRERVRGGLWAMLCLAEREPALARVCLVESQTATEMVSDERAKIVARLGRVLDEGRPLGGRRQETVGAVTAEALIGAVTTVISARLGSAEPVQTLLGELMSMIALLYVGPVAAREELMRKLPAAPVGQDAEPVRDRSGQDPLAGLPMRLTYRTARVLQAVASLGGVQQGPSNREVADHAGVADQGQISKLLARLERNGLVANAMHGSELRGEANSWLLTDMGRRLIRGIGVKQGRDRVAMSALHVKKERGQGIVR